MDAGEYSLSRGSFSNWTTRILARFAAKNPFSPVLKGAIANKLLPFGADSDSRISWALLVLESPSAGESECLHGSGLVQTPNPSALEYDAKYPPPEGYLPHWMEKALPFGCDSYFTVLQALHHLKHPQRRPI